MCQNPRFGSGQKIQAIIQLCGKAEIIRVFNGFPSV